MTNEPPWAKAVTDSAVAATGGRLGAVEAAHWRVVHSYGAQVGTALLGAIGLTALCCGAPFLYTSHAGGTAVAIAVGIGLVFAGFGALVYRRSAPTDQAGMLLLQHGFVHVDGPGRIDVVAYADVDQVWHRVVRYQRNGRQVRIQHQITITRTGGTTISLDDRYQGIAELNDRLARKVTEYKLPGALAQINAGNTLRFAPFGISLHGIDDGRQLLEWGEVEEITVKDGFLSVKKQGKWLLWSSHEVGGIPNFFLFLALVKVLHSAASRP